MDTSFDNFLQWKTDFDNKYEKVRDDDFFDWFQTHGLETLKQYCDKKTSLSYNIEEKGISVELITSKLSILADFDKEIIDLLALSSSCIIQPVNEKKFKINLWFRGWKWIEIKDCPL